MAHAALHLDRHFPTGIEVPTEWRDRHDSCFVRLLVSEDSLRGHLAAEETWIGRKDPRRRAESHPADEASDGRAKTPHRSEWHQRSLLHQRVGWPPGDRRNDARVRARLV